MNAFTWQVRVCGRSQIHGLVSITFQSRFELRLSILCAYMCTVLNLRPFEEMVPIRSFSTVICPAIRNGREAKSQQYFSPNKEQWSFEKPITLSIFRCFFLYWQTCLAQSSTIISWRVSGFQQWVQQLHILPWKWHDKTYPCVVGFSASQNFRRASRRCTMDARMSSRIACRRKREN